MNQLSTKAEQATLPASTTDDGAAVAGAGARERRRRLLRLAAFAAVFLGLAVIGFEWTTSSMMYVHESDARIQADLIAVSSDVEGRLVARLVSDGDAVSQGQVLARIDSREARLRLEEAGAEQAVLLAELARLEAEISMVRDRAESRIASARANLREVTEALDIHKHEFEFASADFERAQSLSKTGAISASRLDRARADYLKARQELARATAEIATARAGVEEARSELDEVSVKIADRARLEAEIAEVATRRDRLQVDLDNRVIRSPIDGLVGRTFVDSGEHVGKGQRLMSVHDPEAIWVEANVRETDVGRLAVGQPVRISVDAYPGEQVSGRVARIATAANGQYALLPRINESGTFTKVTQRLQVRISVDQPDLRLRPGMMVEVEIEAPRSSVWPF